MTFLPKSVSRFLEKLKPNTAKGSSFLATITALESRGGSTDITVTEAETIVEGLDELVPKIQDKEEKEYCLRVLAKVCCEHVVLPKSYIVSGLERGEKWKSGSIAYIWTGRLRSKDVCIKGFRKYEVDNQQRFKGAVYCLAVRWKNALHPNVVPFLGFSEVVRPFGLITPRMSSHIIDYTRRYPDADRILLLANAACGLEYLHSLDIVHGRIKPRNILITEDGKACIGDFGIWEIINASLVAAQTGTTTRQGGGTRYMAPEQLTESFTGKESDVYSFAITAYEVVVEVEPYTGVTGEGPLGMRITGGVRPGFSGDEPMVRQLPGDVRRMLESCWVLERSKRPTIEEVHRALQSSSPFPHRSRSRTRKGSQ